MTDTAPVTAPSASSSTARPTTNTNTNNTTSQPPPRPKRKTKARRKARRRDGDDDGDASDNDPTPSSQSGTGSKPARDSKPSSSSSTPRPLFPDTDSTTPVVWADSDPKSAETVSFDEFARGTTSTSTSASTPTGAAAAADTASATAAPRGNGRGRAVRGGASAPGPSTRDTNNVDSTKRAEERAQLKKERQKAKRKEAKQKKLKPTAAGRDATADDKEDGGDGALGTAAADDESLAAFTSALTLDDTTRNHHRGAYSHRVAEDPKFTPRVGNFWMHDQRHFEASNVGDGSFGGPRGAFPTDHWRGRGGHRGMPRGAFRGAARGRGRGGFAPFVPSPASVSSNGSHHHRMTEMDKLELELSQRERQHRPQPSISSDKWGHEGYEEQASTENSFRNNRAVRGRGRGARGLPRGTVPRAFIPAHLPTPEASPERGVLAIKPTEGTTTQSAADTLLDDSGAVTVRLPGDSQAVELAVELEPRSAEPAEGSAASPATETAATDTTPLAEATTAAAPPPAPASDTGTTAPSSGSPFPPVFTPSNPSPVPYVASDSGSISSGYIPPTTVPPVPMSGEFYAMQQSSYRPPPFYPRNFTPQSSYTPEPGMQPNMHPHAHHQQRPSFSGHGHAGFFPGGAAVGPRSGSPLNPYAGGPMYFMPPQPLQKLQVRPTGQAGTEGSPRSPTSDHTDSNHGHGVPAEGYMPTGYYYNPYSGMTEGGVFYPPQGYWPQAGYDGGVAAYGYDGEYHGY